MYYANIKFPDVSNGLGIRVSLFVSGCTHFCKECFNSEAWDFEYGTPFTDDTISHIVALCEDPIDGLSILGGEPMHPKNQADVLRMAKAFKTHHPNKSLWVFSGYTLEELLDPSFGIPEKEELLSLIDVLVDGRFEVKKRDIRLKFRGSSNQRLIDLKKTLQRQTITIFEV